MLETRYNHYIESTTHKGNEMKKQEYNLPKKLAAQAMIEADNELYSKHLRGEFDEGDPNHPKYNGGFNYATGKYVSLFGYKQDDFMAKQH